MEMTMPQAAKFWDRWAERYSRSPITDEASYQHKLKVTQGYFTPDMEVLELGCGTGSTALIHAPFVKHIRATDLSSKMLDIARAKAKSASVDNVTFEQASVETVKAADNSVDMVLALSVLHLLEDKDAALDKIYRMLKPGGLFISSTACLGDTMWYFKLIAPAGKLLGLLPTLRVFTQENLRQAHIETGFAIEQFWQPAKGKAVFMVARKPG
ncbi:MAG: class I SAM-dependent methyltransferase [Pseudomonadota bacterium]